MSTSTKESRAAIGVVGAGLIGRAHVARLARSPEARLAAICDPAPAARDLAREAGVPFHGDLASMLAGEALDGVIVATPNAMHADQAIACIERRLPVLVEKPLAESLENAARIVAAQDEAGTAVLVGHHRRHSPLLQAARRAVKDGALGRIATVAALSAFLKPDAYFDTAWRREPGGGPVLINLIHTIDDLRFMLGEIAEIKAIGSRALRGFPVEDSAAVVLRFESGALGTITLSDKAAAPWSWELTAWENPAYPRTNEDCYLIAGTEASLAVPSMRSWRHDGDAGWMGPIAGSALEVARADPLDRQIAHFAQVIRGEAAPIIDARDAMKTLAATLEVHRQV